MFYNSHNNYYILCHLSLLPLTRANFYCDRGYSLIQYADESVLYKIIFVYHTDKRFGFYIKVQVLYNNSCVGKVCLGCKKEKQLEDFNYKNKSKGIRQSRCKFCTRLQVRDHYTKNRLYYLRKAKKRNIITRQV